MEKDFETKLLFSVLIQIGVELLTIPENVDTILAVLNKFEGQLILLGQDAWIRHALEPARRGLITDRLFRHPDMDVKVSVLSCIHELIRIFAPEAPYEGDSLKKIFRETLVVLEQLSLLSGRCYNKALHILETVERYRSFLLLLNLGCDGLFIQMFQLFLGTIGLSHSDVISSQMENIMTLVIEETNEISTSLLRPLLVSARKENKNISPPSWRLAMKVLNNCSARVIPHLVELVEPTRQYSEQLQYTDVITSVLPDKPAAIENVMKEALEVSRKRKPKESMENVVEGNKGVVESYNPYLKKHNGQESLSLPRDIVLSFEPKRTTTSRYPEVKWAQREDKVYITVFVPDSENAKVNLDPEGINFTFSGSAGAENHIDELKLELFDKVNVEESKIKTGVRNIVCILEKAEKNWWKNLLREDGKAPHYVKVDWDKWVDEDDDAAPADLDLGGMDFSKFGMDDVD